jgi:hypothetical protein
MYLSAGMQVRRTNKSAGIEEAFRMNDERRKLKRKYLIFFTRVFDSQDGKWLGNLADVTSEGMMIISETPVETGKTFDLSMDLPADIFGQDSLNFKGQSIWCQPDIDPSFHNTGFKLLDLSEDELTIIQRIIDVYGIRE